MLARLPRWLGGEYPATLPLTLWLRDFAGAPWVSLPSIGSSGGRTLGTVTNTPTVGATLNGHASLDIDTGDILAGPAMTDVVSAGAYAGWVLVSLDNANSNGNGIIGQASGAGMNVSRDGGGPPGAPRLNHYGSGGTVTPGLTTLGAATVALIQFRFNGATASIRVNSAAWTSIAATALTGLSAAANSCKIGDATGGFAGQIWDLGLAAQYFDDATFDLLKAYVNTRYALAL